MGEKLEVVGYGFRHVDKGWLFNSTHFHASCPSVPALSLMTVAQHDRMVAANDAEIERLKALLVKLLPPLKAAESRRIATCHRLGVPAGKSSLALTIDEIEAAL